MSRGEYQSIAMESRRASMLRENQVRRMSLQRHERWQKDKEAAWEWMMRRPDTQDLHRQALRKMQERANRHI